MLPSTPDRLTVLIADDNVSDRMLLSAIVSRQGHDVLTASNGAEAVSLFERRRPQLVLMDAMMPVMDGFEAARQIKALAGDALVPIIFLTSLTEGEDLARCLDAGGDDFVAKPYNQLVLAAKINAMNRLRVLQETVLHQRDLITRHHKYLLNEQRVAKALFDQIAHSGCLSSTNIRYLQSPYALFNGDLLLAAWSPSGNMHLLLGDFTGHGLPAAVGAMPLAEVFYGMTAKGYGLRETLREMNAKLKRILPVDMFCCAALLSLNFKQQLVEVWNGGLPDGYLLHGDGRPHTPLISSNVPLGVLSAGSFDDNTQVYPFGPGDRVFLLSDGVVDSTGQDGELFGARRLQNVLVSNRNPALLIEEVQWALARFNGQARDDVSMVEVAFTEPDVLGPPSVIYTDSGDCSPLDWSASFEYRAVTLKRFNPLPYLLQLVQEVHGLRSQSSELYIVLSELYSNALEHGVLGLDSALKRDAEGFGLYYQQRAERLDNLQDGYIRIDFNIVPTGDGGRLTVRVQDSGAGFDSDRVLALPPAITQLSGRGLSLVRQLSDHCQWSDDGRTASVEFAWEGLA
jgi:CheY-like chemotaxis protein/anti-sigma regulatory factor (Ser/Thr protein kinase)